MRSVIVVALLAIGALAMLGAALGMLLTRDALNRVHFLGPASTLGAACIGAAVVVQEGATALTEGAIAVAFVVGVSGPVLAHYLARAAYEVDRDKRLSR
jgi:multicomponent Na+:H+ antiporter subunit G